MILKIPSILSLILAGAWFIDSPDWEPVIVFIASFMTLLTQEIKNSNKEPVNNITEHDKILFAKLLNKLPSTNGGIESPILKISAIFLK